MACSPQRMAAHAQGCTVCDACKAMNSPHDSAFRGNQSDGMRMCNRCYCRPSSRVYGRTGSSCSGRGTARTSRAPLSPGPSAATFGTSVPCRRKVYDEDGRLRECDCRDEGSAGKWHMQHGVTRICLPCRYSRNERRQDVGAGRHGVSVQRAFDSAGGVDDQVVHVLGQELQNSGVHG